MKNKRYGLFNDNRLLIQTQEDLMGNGLPIPWRLLPEDFDIRKPTALSKEGELLIAPSYDYKFNSEQDLWEIDLDTKKNGLLAVVKRLMSVNLFSDISYNGYKYNADPISLENIFQWQNQINLGNLPDNFYWRDADNNNHLVTTDFINGLSLAIAIRKTELYKNLWDHKEAIKNINSAEELNNYNPEKGWFITDDKIAIRNNILG